MAGITTARSYDLPFPRSEFDDRLRRVREGMQLTGTEVQIVMDHRDFYWLTGTKMYMIEFMPSARRLVFFIHLQNFLYHSGISGNSMLKIALKVTAPH